MSEQSAAPAISARGLVKTFGDKRAVDGVDLEVERGTVYGVLGPNGAGKTTTIKMLATLLRPDEGSMEVLGFDVRKQSDEVRRRIALTGQIASVDEELTGRENLILLGKLLGLGRSGAGDRADQLLEGFGLAEASGKLVKNYSGGMRRRLDIAASIVITPELLFLDEPTTGLDPRSRTQVWDIVRALVAQGTTVLLCTQYLDEADQLADRIAVIDHGRVIAEGTPIELKRKVAGSVLHLTFHSEEHRERGEALFNGVGLTQPIEVIDQTELTIAVEGPDHAVELVSILHQNEHPVADFSLGEPTLDEVFLALTGNPLPDEEEEVA